MNKSLRICGILIVICAEAMMTPVSLPVIRSDKQKNTKFVNVAVATFSGHKISSEEQNHKSCTGFNESICNRESVLIKQRSRRKLPRTYSTTSSPWAENNHSGYEQSLLVTLSGHSVHLECVPNAEFRQEPPCILQSSDSVIKSELMYPILPEYERSNKARHLQELSFETGEFAYLPCRTLGAGDEETTIWEKGDNPLFASKIKFSKADRVHLVTGEPSVTHADIRFYGEAFHSKRNKTNQFMSDKQFGMSDQISQWDLVINFLQPADSDTYTCRLVGRTQQLIQYRVNVKEPKPLAIYSTKRLVHMNLPQTVNLGYPFNLTCSVQLSQTNSAYITVDWFRPDHSYDGLQHSVSRSSNVTAPVSGLPSLSNVEEPLPLYDNASAVISWFAHSFTQVVNQPSFGNSLYKQLRIEEDFTYQSEAVFSVQKATAFEEGFYECRAYEPVNYGHERVLDRAITAIVVNRPYPQKPSENGKWFRQFSYLLARYWNLLSVSDQRQHDQHAQNDGGIKVMNWLYPAPRLKTSQSLSNVQQYQRANSHFPQTVGAGAKGDSSRNNSTQNIFLFLMVLTTSYFSNHQTN